MEDKKEFSYDLGPPIWNSSIILKEKKREDDMVKQVKELLKENEIAGKLGLKPLFRHYSFIGEPTFKDFLQHIQTTTQDYLEKKSATFFRTSEPTMAQCELFRMFEICLYITEL